MTRKFCGRRGLALRREIPGRMWGGLRVRFVSAVVKMGAQRLCLASIFGNGKSHFKNMALLTVRG